MESSIVSLAGKILLILKEEDGITVTQLINRVNSGKDKHSATTVSKYIEYLEKEGLIRTLEERYGVAKKKKILLTEKGRIAAEYLTKINEIVLQ
uniref:Conserved conjugative plasmid protein n=1 Tax=Saccharolobus solfataricus (strain ATCC 35092 / DSM 1617 / JCM 11322 / P2) TaxID=273057 RepID=S6E2C7_SACS2|nr:winged helix-turn-helix transcriptional regulator [Saccharolobus solfataricus]CDF66440.1 conserved conjugative plasmid protein [Saccharolobus solfataricus P2]